MRINCALHKNMIQYVFRFQSNKNQVVCQLKSGYNNDGSDPAGKPEQAMTAMHISDGDRVILPKNSETNIQGW